MRVVMADNSRRQARRLYKTTSILDVAGLRLGDLTNKRWHARMAKMNELFQWFYPESAGNSSQDWFESASTYPPLGAPNLPRSL